MEKIKIKAGEKLKRNVYADNAATTKIDEKVLEAMMPYLTDEYANSSSLYGAARSNAIAVNHARASIASAFSATEKEIFFTGGGSESDNWAIKGACYANSKKGKHIISTEIEHHAVLHTLHQLEREGFEVTYLKVNEFGEISVQELTDAIRSDTILITIMYANNEVGTIQPIAEIGKIARERKILFHTDAVQAAGHVPIDVKEMNIDMMSIAGHKFHGPKGIGALYIRRGLKIQNLIEGGGQEGGRRAGTTNVAGIVGMAKALELCVSEMEDAAKRESALRDRLIEKCLTIPYTRLNGHPTKRLPGNVNVSIEYIEGEALVLSLDSAGIAASTGSACSTGSLDPSHVLLAMGLTHEVAHGSLRISLGRYNTEEDIDYIYEHLVPIVDRLRAMSPVWDERKER